MFVPDTPRTAQYRFWFDVRELGAAAYAAKLGCAGLLCFGWSSAWQFVVRGYWPVGLIWLVAMLRLSGRMRQLSPVAAAIGIVLLPVHYVGTRSFFFLPRFDGLAVLLLIGLPRAIWAAWVDRGLALEERLQLVEIPEAGEGWKGRVGEWAGWSCRRGGL